MKIRRAFAMRFEHVDFKTWRVSGDNAGHLADITGEAVYNALSGARVAEAAREALCEAVSEIMINWDVEQDIALQWGLRYDGDACGGDGGYIDEDGDEYSSIYEHSSAGGWVRDAAEEFEEMIARELFAEALLSGGEELERAAIWVEFIRDRGGMRIYEEYRPGDCMHPGEAIIAAAKEADAEHLGPKVIIALGAFLDSNESKELVEILKNKRAQMNAAKALEARPGYAMQRYRDRAAELVAARRDARGWVVLEADTNGRVINQTQCKTKADALREVRRQALYLARQATREFAEYGSAYID